MSKPIYTLISDMERSLSEIKKQSKDLNRNFSQAHIFRVEAENTKLKADLKQAHRSGGQYKAMYEKKAKYALRLEAEVNNQARKIKHLEKQLAAAEVTVTGTPGPIVINKEVLKSFD